MDHAIKHAVLEIKLKEEKFHKSKGKRSKKSFSYETIDDSSGSCEELETQLVEGQQSPILLSPIVDRKNQRREAISEKNLTERALVKSTLKHYMQGEHASRYAIR